MSKKLKAYKVFDSNFQCQGFQFKIGETYRHKGVIGLCESGFHACKKLSDCFSYKSF